VNRLAGVFLGSGLGGAARYLLGAWVVETYGAAFPYGTLAINAIGSFLIMVIMTLSLRGVAIGPDLRLFLTSGIIGGFTTYSTFNYETLALGQRGAPLLGALNVIATVLICLVAGLLGLWVGRSMTHG
jgi:CrcB protein